MHFKRATIFLMLFLAANMNVFASTNYVLPKKSLMLNPAQAKPLVLNTTSAKVWGKEDQVFFEYDLSTYRRIDSIFVGGAELLVGVPFAGLLTFFSALGACAGGERTRLRDWSEGTNLLSMYFFTGRMIFGGIRNLYNGIASTDAQIYVHTKTRWWLGVTELSIAAIAGGFALARNWQTGYSGIFPGCLVLAVVGVGDLGKAFFDQRNGIRIARF